MSKLYKNLKICALSAMMALTGCGLDSSDEAAFVDSGNSITDESSEKISTNKKVPGVDVKTIDDSKYDDDTNSVGDTIDDTEFVVTTMPLESGTSVTVYTTVVGNDSYVESAESKTEASKTGIKNGGSSTRTKPAQTSSNNSNKNTVTTAAVKTTKKVTTTTTEPVVTTTTSVATQPPVSETQPPIETQPAPRVFSIDDICHDSDALIHFAKQFCKDLGIGDGTYFYYDDRELVEPMICVYIVAALNGDVIDDETLGKAFVGSDNTSRIDDSMYFLANYSNLQKIYGFNIDFSKYICTQKDPNGDYANYLNTLQYYGSNGSILTFAAEHKNDYAGDLMASNLLYTYQKVESEDDWFMDYRDVINASAAFNNRALDITNSRSYSYN